jgi:Nucleotidyltransferase domain
METGRNLRLVRAEMRQHLARLVSVESKRYCPRVAKEDLIDEIARRLADATPPRSTIMLFGSQARGDEGADSDIDVSDRAVGRQPDS